MALTRGKGLIKHKKEPEIFTPNKAYLVQAIEEYLNSGGKIRKASIILGEPDEITPLFKSNLTRKKGYYVHD